MPARMDREEAAKFFEQEGLVEATPKINTASQTWKAVVAYVEREIAENYLPSLKNKGVSHDDTQHARGGLEALESLLRFGGESIV